MKSLRALIALLLVAGLSACGGGASVKVAVSPTGEGKITSTMPAGIDCGTRCEITVKLQGGAPVARGQIKLTAIPQPGSRLLGWNREECKQENTCVAQLEQWCAIGQSPLPGCAYWDTGTEEVRPVFVPTAEVVAEGWSPFSACAIYRTGELRCWGMFGEDDSVPEVSNPRQVVTEQLISCVEDGSGVQCWGSHTRPTYHCPNGSVNPPEGCEVVYPERPPLPDLFPPLTLAAGDGFACALDVEGVKCWSGYGDTQVPQLSAPQNIRTENRQICVDDGGSNVCWNKNYALPAG